MARIRLCSAPRMFGGDCHGNMALEAESYSVELWHCVECGNKETVNKPVTATATRPATIMPPPVKHCHRCSATATKTYCGALMCHRCGVWLTSCGDSKCDSMHLTIGPPMTPEELREDTEGSTLKVVPKVNRW